MNNQKTILAIGGTGSIGPYVIKRLLTLGHRVIVYHRGQTECALPPDVEHIHSPGAGIPVLEFPPDIEPDLVIHMIALGERDSRAALERFKGKVERIIWLSSGDVYAAYGRFMKLETGPPDRGLLHEDSVLRSSLYPYRSHAKNESDLHYWYEKILMESTVTSDPQTRFTILRLPKVYGPKSNSDLATIYGFCHHPNWRWTHGYVENVAAAIVLAALHPAAANRIYNVGEAYTPSIKERLAYLPPPSMPLSDLVADFEHDIAYDTSRIREELGYVEPVRERRAMIELLQ